MRGQNGGMPRPSRLLLALRRELASLGDPERARGAQAYMKSAMPFHGVGAVPLRAICRGAFAGLDVQDAEAFRREVLGVFRGAEFREEMYAAVELARWKRASRGFAISTLLPVWEEMVVKGAWWDVVDPVASHLLGELLRKEPRRCAGRCSPGRGAATSGSGARRSSASSDSRRGRSSTCSTPHRTVARVEGVLPPQGDRLGAPAVRADGPGEVRRYVAANTDRLSGLSRREATKHLG